MEVQLTAVQANYGRPTNQTTDLLTYQQTGMRGRKKVTLPTTNRQTDKQFQGEKLWFQKKRDFAFYLDVGSGSSSLLTCPNTLANPLSLSDAIFVLISLSVFTSFIF